VCWRSSTSIDDGAGLPNVTLDHKLAFFNDFLIVFLIYFTNEDYFKKITRIFKNKKFKKTE